MKHWKHLITKDFQHYQSADDLIPCELFESHGCYSGGALKVGDKLAMFYTGNTRRPSDNQRVPYQNLAIFNLNGKLLSKRPLIENAPEGYTELFVILNRILLKTEKSVLSVVHSEKTSQEQPLFLKWTILKIRLVY